jgi:gas vesicle protein
MKQLIIPDVEDAEENVSDHIAVLARALAALAMANGPITILEYTCCVKTVSKIAESITDPGLSASDGPALLAAIVMRALASGKSDLDGALKELKAAFKSLPDDVRKAALETTAPIVALQGDQAYDLYARVAKALNTRVDPRVLSNFVPPRDRSFFNIIKGFVKQRDQRLDSILGVAYAYGHAQLVEEISNRLAEGSPQDLEDARKLCHGLVQQIRADADELFKQRESLALRRELATKVVDAISSNVQQVKQRLHALEREVELQKREFAEDVEDFISNAGNEIALGLQDRARGGDWLKESVWKTFAKNQHGRALQARYEKLKWRHERRVELLEKELMLFQNELSASRPRLLRNIDQKEFVELLLPQPSSARFQPSSARFMTSIDQAASFTILATGVAGAGSLAMVATGFATLTAPLAVPLSAAIIGPMAIAYLYKAFTNPEERKQKEIHNKLQDIEEGIRKVLQGAKETQAATLEALVNEFYNAAEWYLVPLVHSSRRAVDIVSLQERLIEQSVENTIGSLESLSLV